ncbi:MAG: UDP-N-acetylmuramate--alanine ligase [Candidatus Paceibacteria bacterium]|jgi:UDP-N-acetylmuramate--alanine ligase
MTLEKIFKKEKLHIHFIGIGGKGLNGIAKICMEKGFKVSGSDLKKSEESNSLRAKGIKVFYTQEKDNVSEDIDLVVYSSIIPDDHIERVEALKLGIPQFKRAELLGYFMKEYFSVSVAGSHGKSTTTALLGLTLQNSGVDPTVIGGSYVTEWGSYERKGEGRHMVVESCEYDRAFHNLIGDVSVITSIEKSHMEYYKDEREMVDAFNDFVKLHHRDSVIIANGDDTNIRKVISNTKGKRITFGFNECNDYHIKDVSYKTNETQFSVYRDSVLVIKDLKIRIPGSYNVLNFASAVVLHDYLGLPLSAVKIVANTFMGVGRRFEIKTSRDTVFVDDFCHHPTQVKNLFDGIKQFYPDYEIYAVFQPRQFHLMKTFLKEYGSSFRKADHIIVSDIIPALGDTAKDIKGLKTSDVIDSIKKHSFKKNVLYKTEFSDIANNLRDVGTKKVIATIGAGDVYKVRDILMRT